MQFCQISGSKTNLIEFADECISNYGKRGDNSFEYIGLVLRNGIISDKRVYRKRNESILKIIKTHPPFSSVLSSILKEFTDMDGVELCDISTDCTDGNSYFRMIFNLPVFLNSSIEPEYVDSFFMKIDFQFYKAGMMNHISKCNEIARIQIIQLGIEVDSDCKIVGVKYYYNFGNGTINDDIKKFSSYMKETEPDMEKVMNVINSNGYYPVFIGVNNRSGVEERKLYFRSRAFGHQIQDILQNQNMLSSIFGWNTVLTENVLKEMWDRNLYVEGLALSFENPKEWRLYFSALPRRVI